MKNEVRLTEEELKAIKEIALEVFGKDVKVWIFGSRADLNKKGGDIDIYIETNNLDGLIDKQIKYLSKLKLKIGDQKIDLVIKSYDCKEDICIEAKTTGVNIL
ncbi:MAG: nucleotidyltransferase domain-containing protein [Hydrogenobaculum sp.]|nr:MAG: DNA polymerase subunit beta [Hydrogenobaculum sp.]HEK25008.1 nucleotidyltransferase domain-containing protein [Hydrogenobaculum sp.]